jgi:hypothetical protein
VTETTRDIVVNTSNLVQQYPRQVFRANPMHLYLIYSSNINRGFIKLQLTGPKRSDFGNLPADAPFEAFGHKTFRVRMLTR